MGVPKYFEIHKPLLQFLSDGATHSLKEIKEFIINYFHLTDADVSELLPSGRQTYFANRVGWARTYLKKAGLIDSPAKGMFCITAEGKKVVQEDPPVIDNSYLMRYDFFKAFTQPADAQTNTAQNEDDSETPDDALENAFNKINQSLADDILSEVMKLSPTSFFLWGGILHGCFCRRPWALIPP